MRFFLLLSFFIYLFGFEEFYNFKKSSFEFYEDSKTYKLTLKNQRYLNYKLNHSGYKFFIPYFTKEFNLKILRYNSVGHINMLLSANTDFKNILNISPNQLNYYITDYKNKQRQLDYLLKGKTIPYYNTTSISIEAYNIPYSISKHLNRYFYFKIIHKKNNKLQYILYSFYIVFDKQKVDNYIKTHHLKNFQDFIKNIYNIKLTKKINYKIKHKPPYSLHLRRFWFMKEFGYQPTPIKCNIKIQNIDSVKSYLNKQLIELEKLDFYMQSKLDKNIVLDMLNGNKLYKDFKSKLKLIIDNLKHLPFDLISANKNLEDCYFDYSNINKKCFKNSDYFQNYLYFSLKENKIIPDGEIKAFGDYKSFNDIGKYYFEIGDIEKSESFLLKAYYLANNNQRRIIAHNLGVLYITSNIDGVSIKQAIKYLKESGEEIDFYNLGVLYYMGKGVKESDKKAREYFAKAPHIPYAVDNLKIMEKYKIGEK